MSTTRSPSTRANAGTDSELGACAARPSVAELGRGVPVGVDAVRGVRRCSVRDAAYLRARGTYYRGRQRFRARGAHTSIWQALDRTATGASSRDGTRSAAPHGERGGGAAAGRDCVAGGPALGVAVRDRGGRAVACRCRASKDIRGPAGGRRRRAGDHCVTRYSSTVLEAAECGCRARAVGTIALEYGLVRGDKLERSSRRDEVDTGSMP